MFRFVERHRRALPTICHQRWCSRSRKDSYTAGRTDIPLLRDTIGTAFQKAVERTPTKTLCVFVKQDIRKTYEEVFHDVSDAFQPECIYVAV